MTNHITIRGALGQDGELRFTNNGRPVLNLSVADGKSRRTENGEWEEIRPTIWHRVSVWGQLAEMWANSGLLVKGAQVEITGEQTIREYEHNGEQRWSSEISAYQIGVKEPRNQQTQAPQQQYQQPADDGFGSAVPGSMGADVWGGNAAGTAPF